MILSIVVTFEANPYIRQQSVRSHPSTHSNLYETPSKNDFKASGGFCLHYLSMAHLQMTDILDTDAVVRHGYGRTTATFPSEQIKICPLVVIISSNFIAIVPR